MRSRRSLGLTMFVIRGLLPAITYLEGHIYNTNLASYGGPPNQGAMVLTCLAVLASIAVGAYMALVAIKISVLSLRKALSHI